LTQNQTIRDLIQMLQLPILVVASARLGTINHTLLTLEAAQKAKISVRGIVLSGSEDPELESIFAQLTSVPVISRIPSLPEETPERIYQVAQECFQPETLRYLYDC
jgi:dethiobiotin synthetase